MLVLNFVHQNPNSTFVHDTPTIIIMRMRRASLIRVPVRVGASRMQQLKLRTY